MNWEMMGGEESKDYLHIRFSDAPFGYREADLDDIKDLLSQQKASIVEKIKTAQVARTGGILNGDMPVVFSEDQKILDLLKEALIKEIEE